MTITSPQPVSGTSLPVVVQQALDDLIKAARDSFGANLHSVVLFGSAVDG